MAGLSSAQGIVVSTHEVLAVTNNGAVHVGTYSLTCDLQATIIKRSQALAALRHQIMSPPYRLERLVAVWGGEKQSITVMTR